MGVRMTSELSPVEVTEKSVISDFSGDVLHALKESDRTFKRFGEAYFSTIICGQVKGWKRHRLMTLNLFVPVGEVVFTIFDDRRQDQEAVLSQYTLSRENYGCLTVPPMIWVAFKGLYEGENIILNIADMMHDPQEVDRLGVDAFPFPEAHNLNR